MANAAAGVNTAGRGGAKPGSSAASVGGGGASEGGASEGGASEGGASEGGASEGGASEGGERSSAIGGASTGGTSSKPENRAPSITELTFSHSTLQTDALLWAYAKATDPDSNKVKFTYAWTRNGQPVGDNAASLSGYTYFSKGDEIRVTVTPSDGVLSGPPVTSAAIIVENSVPSSNGWASLAPYYFADDATPLECEFDASDPDGDPVTYSYRWYLNGDVTTYTGVSLPETATTLGDSWSCEATATDGSVNGETSSTSNSTRIVNIVDGIYRTNTTWTADKSPYYVANRIQIAAGVTLTIEPGVTVLGNDNYVESWGSISALGTKEKPILIERLSIQDNSTAQSPGKISLAFVEFVGGAINGSESNASVSAADCVFRSSWYAIGLDMGPSASHRFERCVFDNAGWIQSSSPLTLINNVFVGSSSYYNGAGVAVQDSLVATYNTFDTTSDFSISLAAKSADVRNNYWGGVTDAEVPDRIFDNNDDLYITGVADYLPTLASAHADTPPPDRTYFPDQ